MGEPAEYLREVLLKMFQSLHARPTVARLVVLRLSRLGIVSRAGKRFSTCAEAKAAPAKSGLHSMNPSAPSSMSAGLIMAIETP
jgi:hypothetical protein